MISLLQYVAEYGPKVRSQVRRISLGTKSTSLDLLFPTRGVESNADSRSGASPAVRRTHPAKYGPYIIIPIIVPRRQSFSPAIMIAQISSEIVIILHLRLQCTHSTSTRSFGPLKSSERKERGLELRRHLNGTRFAGSNVSRTKNLITPAIKANPQAEIHQGKLIDIAAR